MCHPQLPSKTAKLHISESVRHHHHRKLILTLFCMYLCNPLTFSRHFPTHQCPSSGHTYTPLLMVTGPIMSDLPTDFYALLRHLDDIASEEGSEATPYASHYRVIEHLRQLQATRLSPVVRSRHPRVLMPSVPTCALRALGNRHRCEQTRHCLPLRRRTSPRATSPGRSSHVLLSPSRHVYNHSRRR